MTETAEYKILLYFQLLFSVGSEMPLMIVQQYSHRYRRRVSLALLVSVVSLLLTL